MSKCVDYKTTFPDTHRHFRPATEISSEFPIVCGGLELKKNNFKNKTCLDAQPMNDVFEFSNVENNHIYGPMCKKRKRNLEQMNFCKKILQVSYSKK